MTNTRKWLIICILVNGFCGFVFALKGFHGAAFLEVAVLLVLAIVESQEQLVVHQRMLIGVLRGKVNELMKA